MAKTYQNIDTLRECVSYNLNDINKQDKKNISGITLIALVITIIVLLVLAGVAISIVAGNNGILTRSTDAKMADELGSLKDKVTLFFAEKQIEGEGTFDTSKYTSLDSLGITSKYSNYIGVANGEMYITYGASEQIRKVAQNLGITIAKNKIVENTNEITLEDSEKGYIKNYRIYGNSIQDGTPSPDNPVEIQSVGDRTVNLFDYEDFFANKTEGGGEVESSTNDAIIYHLKANTQYTISTNYPQKIQPSSGETFAVFFVKGGSYSKPSTSENGIWNGQTRTVTTDSEGRLYIACRNSKATVSPPEIEEFSSSTYWLQLEEGSVATSFESYGYKIPITVNNTTMDIFLDEPLRKVGNYEDYIDLKEGKVIRNIKVQDLSDMSNNFRTYPSMKLLGNYSHYFREYFNRAKTDDILSTHFPVAIRGISEGNHITLVTNDNRIYIGIHKDIVGPDNNTEFREWLVTNNPILFYVLKTQTEQTITLPNIQLNQGTNYITVGTNVTPSKIEAEY